MNESPLQQQVARGQALYGERCASCHGADGSGTDDVPRVVGPGSFPRMPRPGSARNVEFVTAADIFTWAMKTMPGDDPGTLSLDDGLAIFAFDLTANGIALDRPLDAAMAQAIVINAR